MFTTALVAVFLLLPTIAHGRPAGRAGTNQCQHHYRVSDYRPVAVRIYHQDHRIVPRQLYRLLHYRVCATGTPARYRMNRITVRQRQWRITRRLREQRQAATRALTPYPGPNGTRWAIPWYIVACESGGSWSAWNTSSGARGPYQFLGWNVPWPVRTAADRLAHHRMAARLWNGGRGRSNWVC